MDLQFKPSDADAQRTTYLAYYSGNACKCGVFLQLYGWIGVDYLWVGEIIESYYQEHSGISREQQEFASGDLVGGNVLAFLNIFDK